MGAGVSKSINHQKNFFILFCIVTICSMCVTVLAEGPFGDPFIAPDFSGTPTGGTVPLQVFFSDETTGSPTGWAWYFGDENYREPWNELTANAEWAGRAGQSCVVLPDGNIILLGGMNESFVFKNDVWQSTDNGATWTQVTGNAEWTGREGHSTVVMPDGSIVLLGGMDESFVFKNDVWQSTDNGATWTQVTGNAEWAGREGPSCVVTSDGAIILTGGFYGIDLKNDTWRSTDNGATWTQVTENAGWTGREGHSTVAMLDGSIVLMGGTDGDLKNDTWRNLDAANLKCRLDGKMAAV